MSGFLLRLRRDRAPRLGNELREQEACEGHESGRDVIRPGRRFGQIMSFKEPLEHAESVSGEPFALFITHLDVDVGENTIYRYTVLVVIERNAAPNILTISQQAVRAPSWKPLTWQRPTRRDTVPY